MFLRLAPAVLASSLPPLLSSVSKSIESCTAQFISVQVERRAELRSRVGRRGP